MGTDIHIWVEIKTGRSEDGAWVSDNVNFVNDTNGRRHYSGRNYRLFGALADAGRGVGECLIERRGFPADASTPVQEVSLQDPDLWGWSYWYLGELTATSWGGGSDAEYDEGAICDEEFQNLVNRMAKVYGPDCMNVRIVFAFDN